MREVVLDTETTGLDVHNGHKIIEIGALEIINLVPSGRTLHLYINPERDIDEEAIKIHGITQEFISNKPTFNQIAQKFLDFIKNDQLVIHNASFDLGFLNFELRQSGFQTIPEDNVTDTLKIARKKFPGAQASLDALCRRFQIDNSHRELHGALIDADLLASVYVELKGGLQPDLQFNEIVIESDEDVENFQSSSINREHRHPRHHEPTREELRNHTQFLKLITDPIWYHSE
jgi:DNA polymerase-3 subunit epsilon